MRLTDCFSTEDMLRGLTYIELLVTFALVAIMATLGGVAYLRATGPTTVTRATARELAADLRLASQYASATQINHAVRLDSNPAPHYHLVRLADPEVEIKTVNLPQNVIFSAITFSQNTAIFNVLGAALAAGAVTLQHSAGNTSTVEVRPSGYVRVL